MNKPEVGVVTVLYNSADHLQPFLESLDAQVGVEFRLFVVDNASRDDGLALANNFAFGSHVSVEVTSNARNNGIGAANNQGILSARQAGLDWVLLLNNDTEFGPTLIARLLAIAREKGARVLSPVITSEDPPGALWYGGGRTIPWQGHRVIHRQTFVTVTEGPTSHGVATTMYAPTCCLLVDASVFDEVGVMDPSYFVYFDDTDFSVRCTIKGVQTYVTSDAQVLHKAGGSTGGKTSDVTLLWHTRNWALMARRHLPRLVTPVALAYIQLWMFGRLVLRKETVGMYRRRQRSFVKGVRFPIDNHEIIYMDPPGE